MRNAVPKDPGRSWRPVMFGHAREPSSASAGSSHWAMANRLRWSGTVAITAQAMSRLLTTNNSFLESCHRHHPRNQPANALLDYISFLSLVQTTRWVALSQGATKRYFQTNGLRKTGRSTSRYTPTWGIEDELSRFGPDRTERRARHLGSIRKNVPHLLRS